MPLTFESANCLIATSPRLLGSCARGMRDNPIHVQAFGADPLQRQRRLARFFAALVPLVQRKGTLIGAYDSGVLIAVLGLLPPGACRPTRLDILRLLPSLLTSNSPAGLLRVWRWLGAWAKNDPPEHHWHLGPLAVDVARQGQGVGTRLMLQCNTRLDALDATAYLETDKSINVIFYEKFGFSTMATVSVLGVSNWLMKRPAPSDGAATGGHRDCALAGHREIHQGGFFDAAP